MENTDSPKPKIFVQLTANQRRPNPVNDQSDMEFFIWYLRDNISRVIFLMIHIKIDLTMAKVENSETESIPSTVKVKQSHYKLFF